MVFAECLILSSALEVAGSAEGPKVDAVVVVAVAVDMVDFFSDHYPAAVAAEAAEWFVGEDEKPQLLPLPTISAFGGGLRARPGYRA